MMKTVLYIGGFEMPDKNAAAQRVLSIAKALSACGYSVSFRGVTKDRDYEGVVEGFPYEAVDYPRTTSDWIRYAIGVSATECVSRIKPDIVILYNYPAVAQERVLRYCKKRGISVVGDITEWYNPKSLLKGIDVWLRMNWSNRHLDGIISISRLLHRYYDKHNSVLIPPLVDRNEEKWVMPIDGEDQQTDAQHGRVRLVYAGSPSGTKDRLDYVIHGIKNVEKGSLSLDVIGITQSQYHEIYGADSGLTAFPIRFLGRLPHKEAVSHLRKADFQVFFRDDDRTNNAGFPTKFVEATSAGILVITNKVGDIADYLKTGVNGFMIEDISSGSINGVLKAVSILSRKDIDDMKKHIDSYTFDYHNYVDTIRSFVEGIRQ